MAKQNDEGGGSKKQKVPAWVKPVQQAAKPAYGPPKPLKNGDDWKNERQSNPKWVVPSAVGPSPLGSEMINWLNRQLQPDYSSSLPIGQQNNQPANRFNPLGAQPATNVHLQPQQRPRQNQFPDTSSQAQGPFNPYGIYNPVSTPQPAWLNLWGQSQTRVPQQVTSSQQAINQTTRMVRTGEGTYQEIPYQAGMTTGTFFSGGVPTNDPRAKLYSDMRGRSVNRNAGFIVTPKYVPQKTTSTGGGSGGGSSSGGTKYKKPSYGGGYSGGGYDGGGYSYNDKTPSWLMNLYNWQFKG
jgi:hypothetical protein